jgi:hypothetical protein
VIIHDRTTGKDWVVPPTTVMDPARFHFNSTSTTSENDVYSILLFLLRRVLCTESSHQRSSSVLSFVAKARTRDFRRRWNWQRRSGPGIRGEYRAAPAHHGLEMEVKGRRVGEDTRLSGTSGTWHVFVRPGRRITWAPFGRSHGGGEEDLGSLFRRSFFSLSAV